jgi:hypothetical protein
MVHGKQPGDCQAVLAEISRVTGIDQYAALYSTKEYKKIRVTYFTPQVNEWEAAAESAESVGGQPD